jgi:hypothetical protein
MRPSEQEVANCSSHEVRRSTKCVEHRREPVERAQLGCQVHLEESDRVDLDERA